MAGLYDVGIIAQYSESQKLCSVVQLEIEERTSTWIQTVILPPKFNETQAEDRKINYLESNAKVISVLTEVECG